MDGSTGLGHRARLRQRFLAAGPRAFLDHEILEMLLAQVDRRGDTKPRAYALIEHFGDGPYMRSIRPVFGRSLAPVLLAAPGGIIDARIGKVGKAMAFHLAAVRAAAARVAEASMLDKPVLGNWGAVVAYAKTAFATVGEHRLFVLFLDYRHRLMRYPAGYAPDIEPNDFARSAVAQALRRSAAGTIVVRSNPGRIAAASKRDFELADALKQATGANSMLVHDYILMGGDGFLSLRSMGFLESVPCSTPERLPAVSDREAEAPCGSVNDGREALPDINLKALRTRAEANGVDSLDDVELLGLLLLHTIPDHARFAFAYGLIDRFDGLGRVLSQPLEELASAIVLPPPGATVESAEVHSVHLGVIGEAANRLQRGLILDAPLLDDPAALVRYCRVALGHEPIEQFRVLFLDKQGRLVWDEILSRGTVNHAPAHPREVATRALRLNADSIVLCHNHPTGEATPSPADIDMTRQIVDACAAVAVPVLDHIIVAQSEETSLRQTGQMPGVLGTRPQAK